MVFFISGTHARTHTHKEFIPKPAVTAQLTDSNPVSHSDLTVSMHAFRQVVRDRREIRLGLNSAWVLSCLTSAIRKLDVKCLLTVWAPSHSQWKEVVLSDDRAFSPC